jgi:hypothetical protein
MTSIHEYIYSASKDDNTTEFRISDFQKNNSWPRNISNPNIDRHGVYLQKKKPAKSECTNGKILNILE